jgi:hypothetical protein
LRTQQRAVDIEKAHKIGGARLTRDADKLRRQQARKSGLLEFVRYFWHVLEPPTRDLIEGWPLESICEHLAILISLFPPQGAPTGWAKPWARRITRI